jgi:hypothetical protein
VATDIIQHHSLDNIGLLQKKVSEGREYHTPGYFTLLIIILE